MTPRDRGCEDSADAAAPEKVHAHGDRSTGRAKHRRDDRVESRDDQPVVDAHDRITAASELEIPPVIARLLPGVPAPPVDFDDDAPLHQQIDPADTGDDDLGGDMQTRVAQGHANERLDPRFAAVVEVIGREPKTPWGCRSEPLELGEIDDGESEGAVEHSDDHRPGLTAQKVLHGVRRREEKAVRRRRVDASPVEHDVSARRSSRGTVGLPEARRLRGDVDVEGGTGRLEASEQRERGHAGQPTADGCGAPERLGHPATDVGIAPCADHEAVGERAGERPSTRAGEHVVARVDAPGVESDHWRTVADAGPIP